MTEVIDKNNILNLDEAVTQTRFGELIGVSQAAVSDMVQRGVLLQGQNVGAWLKRYCGHIREYAAGRAGNGDLDLVSERARLASEQADRIALQNQVTRQEFGPIDEMEVGLSDVMATVASMLDTIPGKIKRVSDALTQAELDAIEDVIADSRNEIARLKINWFGEATETDETLD